MATEERWVSLLGVDPRPWLMASDEPSARWLTLTGLLDTEADDPAVVEARAGLLADTDVRDLISKLPDWEAEGGPRGSLRD